MTELEQYKKAYATLVGRVDRTITKLHEASAMLALERISLNLAADELKNALNSAEEIFLSDDPEGDWRKEMRKQRKRRLLGGKCLFCFPPAGQAWSGRLWNGGACGRFAAYRARFRYSMGLTPSTRRKHWEK